MTELLKAAIEHGIIDLTVVEQQVIEIIAIMKTIDIITDHDY